MIPHDEEPNGTRNLLLLPLIAENQNTAFFLNHRKLLVLINHWDKNFWPYNKRTQ